jgi:hypothetical protein
MTYAQSGTDKLPTIEQGDFAASAGDWPKAIDIWTRLLDGKEGLVAAHRLRWFMSEMAGEEDPASTWRKRRSGAALPMLFALGCGIMGTAFVLAGENQSGSTRNILSAAAWLMYIACAILVVSHAYRVGKTPPSVPDQFSTLDRDRASKLANMLGNSGKDSPRDT